MKAPVRIAIVGYGTAGPLHALAYSLLPKLFPGIPRVPELTLIIDTDQRALSLAGSTCSSRCVPPIQISSSASVSTWWTAAHRRLRTPKSVAVL